MRVLALLAFLVSPAFGQISMTADSIVMPLKTGELEVKRTIKTYPIYTKQIDADTHEIGLTFSVCPSTNMFSFDLSGTDGLDFFYQPELTESEKAFCTRPDNVVGSYAVYYKSGGKAFHIYRPQMIADDGKKIWCDMFYRNGALEVVCDAAWLKDAKYPVVLDPIIGYTKIGGSEAYIDYAKAGQALGWAVMPSTETGTNAVINAYIWQLSSVYAKLALYKQNPAVGIYNTNAVGDYVEASYTGIITMTDNPVWVSSATSASLEAGTTYWICGAGSTVFRIKYDGGVNGDFKYKYANYYDAFPQASLPGLDAWTGKVSCYIEYTAGGGGAAAPARKRRRVSISNGGL